MIVRGVCEKSLHNAPYRFAKATSTGLTLGRLTSGCRARTYRRDAPAPVELSEQADQLRWSHPVRTTSAMRKLDA